MTHAKPNRGREQQFTYANKFTATGR